MSARKVFGRLRKVIGDDEHAQVFIFELKREGLCVRRFKARKASEKVIPFAKLAEAWSVGQIELFKL